MLEWLFQLHYDAPVTVAIWSTIGVIGATIVLFAYTVGLRVATIIGERRRARTVAQWRNIIATTALSSEKAESIPLPSLSRAQRTDLLEEWNRARDTVGGTAAENLVTLAKRLGLPEIAKQMLARRRLSTKLLAVQTLGHLRDKESWPAIEELLKSDNTAMSITAAVALTDIDPKLAVERLVPLITKRRDWPRTRVSRFLRMVGSELVSEPMYRAIRSSDPDEMVYLLQFVQLAESDVIDALAQDLIRTSKEPEVLTAALKLVSGHAGVPRIAALARHETWFVRMQAAKVLGRVGQEEQLPLLESMLDDQEWWVRYRAAQSIVSLPFLGPNAVRQLRNRQKDRYARDILEQALAEVGLA
jgi:HEAT repeat protein